METRENKMGVMPIKKLVISMALPMMFSMLVQALYNIVDSYFVARLSEDALAAVTVAFPIQNMMIAVGSGTGVGINALLSRSLGEKRFDRADDAANTGIALAFFSYLAFLVIGLTASRPFIISQTSSEAVREFGIIYTTLCCTMSIGVFFQMTFERLLQSTGRTVLSMLSQVTGAVINILLDPILIFGLWGAPALGIAGAAIATVFGQIIASVLGLFLNLRFNHDIHLSGKRILRPKAAVVRDIYLVAVPSILMMAIGSIMSYAMNRILDTFSSTATAVFGAYFKLQSFFFMPVFGINAGIIPILAYNLGAGKKDRIRGTLRFALGLAVVIMVLGTLCFELFPAQLLGIFNASGRMLTIGIPAMRIVAVHFPLAAVCIILGSVFQAFSVSIYSLIVSVCRQLVILIPAAYLLARSGIVDLVWLSFPIAEVMSVVITLLMFRRVCRKILHGNPLKRAADR